MKADGEVVGYHKYDSKTAEKTDVLKLIRRLLSEGISRNDIVILSPYRMVTQIAVFIMHPFHLLLVR